MCAPAADGTKQLAGACKREYVFTNNPLITLDGQQDQTSKAMQELALNKTELEIWVKPLCCHKDLVTERRWASIEARGAKSGAREKTERRCKRCCSISLKGEEKHS